MNNYVHSNLCLCRRNLLLILRPLRNRPLLTRQRKLDNNIPLIIQRQLILPRIQHPIPKLIRTGNTINGHRDSQCLG